MIIEDLVYALYLEKILFNARIEFRWYTEGRDTMLVCCSLNGVFTPTDNEYHEMRYGLDKGDYIMLQYNSKYKHYIMAVHIPSTRLRDDVRNAIGKDLGYD